MRIFGPGGLALLSAAVLTLGACDGDGEDSDTDLCTEGTEGTGVDAYDTGLELFGITVTGTISGEGEGMTFSGESTVYDVAFTDGALGNEGDTLCEYTYPATGVSTPPVGEGFDSNNAPVTLTCDDCTFALATTLAASTNKAGDFCDYWYDGLGWEAEHPFTETLAKIGFSASYDDPTTEEIETAPAAMLFYDGSGTGADDQGEIAAEWYATGIVNYNTETGAFDLDLPVQVYVVYELAYYQ